MPAMNAELVKALASVAGDPSALVTAKIGTQLNVVAIHCETGMISAWRK